MEVGSFLLLAGLGLTAFSSFPMKEPGPVQIEKGTVIHKRWKIVRKLGEGGCGAVYKVRDLTNNELAALKAESNFVAGGSVLKLEVQILNRLSKRRHVARMLHCGKKETYSYMVMTLLGESLGNLLKKFGRISSVSTQMRVGINVLFGVKQIHDIGFVHRDLKPANIAIGRSCTDEHRFLHILDFGLVREYVMMDEQGQPRLRRPRERALFRGTTRYCSINTHERAEQGRADDLWSLLYLLAEMRGPLPWSETRDKKEVHEIKKRTEFDVMLENCPVQLIDFATHLNSLDYFHRPDYALLFSLLNKVMTDGEMRFSDPWDWERPEVLQEQSGHKKDDGEEVVKPLKMDERTARRMDKAFTIDDFSEDVFGF